MSKIEVNTVEPQCGTTLTLGGSGDTVTLGTGASQSGFGRTGTVDWITTPKTNSDSPLTAATGKGYFLNTTAGTITVNLPAGTAGSIVAFKDYANTWDTNAVTITPNGSDKIAGTAASGVLNTESQSVTLIFIDSTRGWLDVHDSTSDVQGASFITASVSGACNTLTTVDTNYKVATFLGPGTFTVCSVGNSAGSNTVDYMVVAGGGGAGGNRALGNANGGGGGGAGGYRESPGAASGCYTVSPLGTSPAAALPVSVQGYPITVGGGGSGQSCSPPTDGNNGNPSLFSTITSTAGGGGAGSNCSGGKPGGSGGGGGPTEAGTGTGGTGNTPPVSPPQGQNGQTMTSSSSGYGGSALACNTGATSSINGTPTARAGGGAGGPSNSGSPGGGGNSGATNASGTAGTTNTGGGGGGAGAGAGGSCGGAGGSGIVIIRYKFQ